MWRSEDNMQILVLSFCHVSPGDQKTNCHAWWPDALNQNHTVDSKGLSLRLDVVQDPG
ncbi:hypothetical protein I79_002144 [Cricetulus griseus]|uniref:Uncharacterized protein n=1 Tax=Cricetulus griseus TaxID=10029 RepID=G3GWL8_CRIGR|nr:hypothetical protein I79_002144 [Cricetulus griseus]